MTVAETQKTRKVTLALKVPLFIEKGAAALDRVKELRNQSHRILNKAMTYLVLHADDESNRPPETRLYRHIRALTKDDLNMPSSMASAYSRTAWQRFKADRKALLKGDQGIPSWTYPSPVLVRNDNWKIVSSDDGEMPVISVKLHGGYSEWMLMKIGLDKTVRRYYTSWMEQVRYALDHPDMLGDLKIVYNRRKRRWYGIIAYNREIEIEDPGNILGVHFGMTVPIQTATPEGKSWTIGNKREIWEFRAQMKDRKRRLGRRSRSKRGQHGGGGKGWKRRNRSLQKLRDAESRWIDTKVKQYAAAVVQSARKFRCGTIAVGTYEEATNPVSSARNKEKGERDWVEHQVLFWQPARLRDAVEWTAKREGLNVLRVEEANQSITCSECGHRDKESRVSRKLFRCQSCGHSEDAEVNAAKNLASKAKEIQ